MCQKKTTDLLQITDKLYHIMLIIILKKKKKTCIKIGWKIRKFKFWNSAFVGPFQWNISPKPYEIEEIRRQTTGSSVPEMDGRPVAKCD